MGKVFENYSEYGNKYRSKSLQRAILDMIDNSTLKKSSGQDVFSYAHPIFWAPFIVVGDGV
jgi:CHAT domain-containing protein